MKSIGAEVGTPWGSSENRCSRSNPTDQRAGRYRNPVLLRALRWLEHEAFGAEPVAVHRHRGWDSARTRPGVPAWRPSLGGPFVSEYEAERLNDIALFCRNTAQFGLIAKFMEKASREVVLLIRLRSAVPPALASYSIQPHRAAGPILIPKVGTMRLSP